MDVLVGSMKRLSRTVCADNIHYLLQYALPKTRCMSSIAATKQSSSREVYRTAENDPMETFNERCLMVRQPSVEVNGYLSNFNYEHPVPRFIYYGKRGAGRASCLAHTMHWCNSNNWIILHVPYAGRWMRVNEWHPRKEVMESTYRPDRWDCPADAVEWLTHFRIQNQGKLRDLKTTSEYVWTKREKAEVGTPLDEIINFGLSRFKFSVDVVGVLLKELREQANVKGFKVLVAVSGVNAFFVPWNANNCIKILRHHQQGLLPEQLSLIHHFKKMMSPTWSGGAVVGTVSATSNNPGEDLHDTPKYLLQQKGFEWMDPYVPVEVPEYSKQEAINCLRYYIDRNWIQNEYGRTEEGMKEIMFVSNMNPFNLYRVCASL